MQSPLSFDRSLLPPAEFEFAVLADTHYMVDPGDAPLEFESRRKQTPRVAHALDVVRALDTPLVMHLGDISQESPGSPLHERALAEAGGQIERHLAQTVRFVAGNQDVGDKPDPTMPTEPVTGATLAAYERRFGPSWYSVQAGGCHLVVINSSILNSTIPSATAQREWLERDLAAHAHERTFLFLHHPPYLFQPDEPGLGHYDNVDEPARGWLLALARRHNVECIFAGHSHFAWYDVIAPATRFFVCVSTSFTRPGFGELFSSAPANEQGRDDTAKLGLYLVRVQPDGARVHFIRTGGAEFSETTQAPTAGPQPPAKAQGDKRPYEPVLLTRLPKDLPSSPLGVTLTSPLASVADVPLAWPSAVRQRVRNDYPFLSLLELGARHVRFPASDLAGDLIRRRAELLKSEGVALTATYLWHERLDLPQEVSALAGLVDTVEIQLPGTTLPPAVLMEQLHVTAARCDVQTSLAPLIPRELLPGKLLRRTRIGYTLPELPALGERLAQLNATIDRVLVRIAPTESPWQVISAAQHALPRQIGAIDWSVPLPHSPAWRHTARAAEALFAAALHPTCRLFFEPLIDLDRTMDVSHGLLDRRCNPRPAFHALRRLNTILFASVNGQAVLPPDAHASYSPRTKRTLTFYRGDASFTLRLPQTRAGALELRADGVSAPSRSWRLAP